MDAPLEKLKTAEPGAYEDVSRADYDSIPAMNHSLLRNLARSPAHLKHAMDSRESKDTDALRMGSATHTAVFEPDEFIRQYALFEGERRTKAKKEEWDAIVASGKTPLKSAEYEEALAMRNAVRACPEAVALLEATESVELVLIWEDPDVGTKCKARIDHVSRSGELWLLTDLKTTMDGSDEGFGKSIVRYDYHVQAASYLRGWMTVHPDRPNQWRWIVVEKTPPYVCRVVSIDDASLAQGERTYVERLKQYQWCEMTDHWPGYENGSDLSIPHWAIEPEIRQEYAA